jgi:hypothetical protein
MLHLILSIVLLSAPPLTPTYSSCFEAFLAKLTQINTMDSQGLITHETARTRRLQAIADYQQCKRDAFRSWLRDNIRRFPDRLDDR